MTVDPASAVPITRIWLALAGEAGLVPLSTGGDGVAPADVASPKPSAHADTKTMVALRIRLLPHGAILGCRAWDSSARTVRLL